MIDSRIAVPAKWLDYFDLSIEEYEPAIYRLYVGVFLSQHCLPELSFIEADLPLLDGSDLARFLAQFCSAHKEATRFDWPLFSHDPSYPTYAWTKAANAFYDARHKERLRYEYELDRRAKDTANRNN